MRPLQRAVCSLIGLCLAFSLCAADLLQEDRGQILLTGTPKYELNGYYILQNVTFTSRMAGVPRYVVG